MRAKSNPVKSYLPIALTVAVLAIAGCLCALILTVRRVIADIPIEIQATRSELLDQLKVVRKDALAEIDSQAKGIRRDATNQLSVIRKDALSEVDRQLAGIRTDLQSSIAQSIDKIVAPLEGIRTDLQPVLSNAASIEAHADEAVAILTPRDALPAQILGLIAASKVTAGETAQTMRAIRDAAPQFIANGEVTTAQVAGVVTDIHKLTTKFTAPLTLKQKIWEGFKAVSILLSRVI